jgi:hypothetical protein
LRRSQVTALTPGIRANAMTSPDRILTTGCRFPIRPDEVRRQSDLRQSARGKSRGNPINCMPPCTSPAFAGASPQQSKVRPSRDLGPATGRILVTERESPSALGQGSQPVDAGTRVGHEQQARHGRSARRNGGTVLVSAVTLLLVPFVGGTL